MDQKTKAAAALTLIRAAIATDDQDAFDLMSEVIDGNKLYYVFADDAGNQFDCMADFLADLENESPPKPNGIRAAAGAHRPRRMTPQERYAERQAANRAGR